MTIISSLVILVSSTFLSNSHISVGLLHQWLTSLSHLSIHSTYIKFISIINNSCVSFLIYLTVAYQCDDFYQWFLFLFYHKLYISFSSVTLGITFILRLISFYQQFLSLSHLPNCHISNISSRSRLKKTFCLYQLICSILLLIKYLLLLLSSTT